jgi:hypothetical protein
MDEMESGDWSDLGIEWRAIDPDLPVITARLDARLRRQSRRIAAGLVLMATLCVAGLLLGATTLWIGWRSGTWHFLVRGAGILIVSGMLAGSAWLLAPAGTARAATLSQMIDLAIERSLKLVRLTRSGLWACGVAALCGLAGAAIRTRLAAAPQMSPLVDLALLGLLASVLYLGGRRFETRVRQYVQVKKALRGAP